jgi:hypothetical protein
VWPETETVDAAVKRAEKACKATGNATGIKVMLPSHVAGGFWLQLPAEFARALPQPKGPHRMWIQGEDGVRGDVVWLRRAGNGGGLSGGWRGFAIANMLAVGDVVMFEKLPGKVALADGESPHIKGVHRTEPRETIKVTIFRAISEEERKKLADDAGPIERAPKRMKVEDQDDSEGDEEFVVEKVLEHRKTKDGMQYFVKWQDYDETSWEPRESFVDGDDVLDKLLKYEKAHGIKITAGAKKLVGKASK